MIIPSRIDFAVHTPLSVLKGTSVQQHTPFESTFSLGCTVSQGFLLGWSSAGGSRPCPSKKTKSPGYDPSGGVMSSTADFVGVSAHKTMP